MQAQHANAAREGLQTGWLTAARADQGDQSTAALSQACLVARHFATAPKSSPPLHLSLPRDRRKLMDCREQSGPACCAPRPLATAAAAATTTCRPAAAMLLRVRGPQGQATLKVEPDTTVDAFRALLEEKTGVPAALQEARQPAGCCRRAVGQVEVHAFLKRPALQ